MTPAPHCPSPPGFHPSPGIPKPGPLTAGDRPIPALEGCSCRSCGQLPPGRGHLLTLMTREFKVNLSSRVPVATPPCPLPSALCLQLPVPPQTLALHPAWRLGWGRRPDPFSRRELQEPIGSPLGVCASGGRCSFVA